MKLIVDGKEIEHRVIRYPAGEVGVVSSVEKITGNDVVIQGSIFNMDDLMVLGGLVDIVRNVKPRIKITFDCGFLAYGRQDKRTQDTHESLSSKIMATFLNSLKLNKVLINNPHSNASISNIRYASISTLTKLNKVVTTIHDHYFFNKKSEFKDLVLVSPDQNAIQMTDDFNTVVESLNMPKLDTTNFIKKRDPTNTKPLEFILNDDYNVNGKDCLIIDDICDGGGTFIGIANILRENGAKSISLYVTHGLFTRKGINEHLDHVFYCNVHPSSMISDTNTTHII